MKTPRVALLAALALGGCHNDPTAHSAALVPLAGCDQALEFVRQVALDRMNRQIDAQLQQFSSGQRCYYYGGFGEGDSSRTNSAGGAPLPAPPTSTPTAGPGGTTTDPSHATNASGTNNQVADVDEADFVKNDGKYIYLAQNGVLRIVDAYPGPSAHEVSVTPLDGTPRKLFVDGDRALVYVSVPDPRTANPDGTARATQYGSGRECTYGYDCDYTGDGTATKLELFDLADRAHPAKLRDVFLSGSLIAARRIGSTTHTVVTDNLQLFPTLQFYPQEDLCGYAEKQAQIPPWLRSSIPPIDAITRAAAAYEKLRALNRGIILGTDLSNILPRLADSAFGATTLDGASQLCDGMFRSQLLDGASFTTVVSVDMNASTPAKTASILSSPGAVYASDVSLYLAVPSEKSYGGTWYDGWEDAPQVSTIHKFRVSANAADTGYIGSGLVAGRVLNQFSMDELGGVLRIATTTGHVPDPNVISQLTLLADTGSSLRTVGKIGGIAPKEDIRSARFEGTRGFVVTFKKTDPLYVFDLSDPTHPRTTGELKIPGFSTYLHMLDDNHLLSIGYNADDHDSFAFFNGVLLQVFDVSDPTNPTLVQRYNIGTRGTSSDALTNHLAFTYFAPLKLLAVPMTICEGGGDGHFGDQLTFTGLMLFNIDAEAGITEHGRVAYPMPALASAGGPTISCNTWWTDAHSDVKRSIFMDHWVYAISDSLLKIQSVDQMGTDLQSIDLGPVTP